VGEDGVTGMLVTPGDPGELAAAIQRVLTDRELASKLAANARRRVLERFTWQACASATADHYRWVIEEKQRREAAAC
jgi:glycosyltransferase involved in cell wall biosynthesis